MGAFVCTRPCGVLTGEECERSWEVIVDGPLDEVGHGTREDAFQHLDEQDETRTEQEERDQEQDQSTHPV